MNLTIMMHDDGGATVTERLRVTEALRQLDRGMPAGKGILRHLKREAVLERMKMMGNGMTLASHKDVDLPDGSRESVAVYRIPDIEALRLPNPFVQNHPPAPMMRMGFRPCYKSHRSGEVGTITVRFDRVKSEPKTPAKGEEKDGAIPAGSPLDLQLYRDLRPVFADLASEFQVKVSLIVPNQPASRRRPAGDRTITLLRFSDKDTDRYAEPFLRNEEAMLALLQFKVNDPAITRHTGELGRNHQVPVHRGRRVPYHSDSFRIRPTRHLFKKYYAGRPKSEGGDR